MEKILKYKIIRYILAVCLSLLVFLLAIIVDSIEPALSNWIVLVFAIVLIYSLTWARDYPDIGALKFTNVKLVFFKVIKYCVAIALYLVLLGILSRFVIWGYEWLKFGASPAQTICNNMGWFCNNYTGWVGVDKILDWFGSNDVLIMLIIFLAFGAAVLLFIPDNSDDAVN